MFSEKFRCYSFNGLKCSSNELVLDYRRAPTGKVRNLAVHRHSQLFEGLRNARLLQPCMSG